MPSKFHLPKLNLGNLFGLETITSAASALKEVLDIAFDFSQFSGAWLSLWLGYVLELSGNYDDALYFYQKACTKSAKFTTASFVNWLM